MHYQHTLAPRRLRTRVMCASSSNTSSAATSGGLAATAWLMLPRLNDSTGLTPRSSSARGEEYWRPCRLRRQRRCRVV